MIEFEEYLQFLRWRDAEMETTTTNRVSVKTAPLTFDGLESWLEAEPVPTDAEGEE
jgi:hypothetical protein